MIRLPSVLAVLLIAVLAACTASSSPSVTAEPTEEPTVEASESESAEPSSDLPSEDEELEGLIPDEVAGLELEKSSITGEGFLDTGGSAEAESFFEAIGVDPANVSVATGFGLSEDFTKTLYVLIFRAPGASSDVLLEGFKSATDEGQVENGEEPLDWAPANVGGKNVETAIDPSELEQTVYLYGVADMVIVIGSTDEAAAAEVLAGLP